MEGADQREFVGQRESVCGEELRQAMQGCWQREWTQSKGSKRGAPTSGFDHRHLAGPADAVRDPDAPVKTNEIRAAAEEHVLTVVDNLANARMQIRTGTPAQVAAPFDQFDAQPGLGQRAGRAHAGHAAAYHGDGLL